VHDVATHWRPPFGFNATLVVVALTCLAAAAIYLVIRRSDDARWVTPSRRLLLAGCRLAALGALLYVLLGPGDLFGGSDAARPPKLVVLADVSASMLQEDVPAGDSMTTRWMALARPWLDAGYIRRLQQQTELSVYRFGEGIERAVPQLAAEAIDGEKATAMYAAIREATSSGDESGIVLLLSDGHDTQRGVDPGLVGKLQAEGWQVLAVPVGARQSARDVNLMAWADADYVMAGQSTWINATVVQNGFDQAAVEVDLMLDGRRIDRKTVRFDGKPTQRVRFQIRPEVDTASKPTLHGYRVVAGPLDGEAIEQNNERHVFVQARDDRIRVVLFEGQPYWDTKFLAQVLRDDVQIDLVTVHALGSRRTVAMTHLGGAGDSSAAGLAAPANQAALNAFDVVILGKGCERFFPGDEARMLASYVQDRGGVLLLARSEPFDTSTAAGRQAATVLDDLMPVTWGRQQVRQLGLHVTREGRDSPLLQFDESGSPDAVITRLPDMLAATRVAREKAASIVLLRQRPRVGDGGATPNLAAVAHQNVGGGRVFAVLTDGMWQWAFLDSSKREYDSVYQTFWSRAIRWLVTGGEFLPGQDISLGISRFAAGPGEPIHVTVSTRQIDPAGFDPRLTVIGPDGSREQIELARPAEQSTRFTATLRPMSSGVHVLQLNVPGYEPQTIESRFAVYDQSEETLNPSARPSALKQLTDATGGACLAVDERERVFEFVERLRASRQSEGRLDYVFDRGWLLGVILGLLAVEWFVRRRNGLR